MEKNKEYSFTALAQQLTIAGDEVGAVVGEVGVELRRAGQVRLLAAPRPRPALRPPEQRPGELLVLESVAQIL